MLKKSYAGLAANGNSARFGVVIDTDIRPLTWIDPNTISNNPSAIISPPSGDVLATDSSGAFQAVAEVHFDAASFMLAIDNGVFVITPMFYVEPALTGGVGGNNKQAFTVGNLPDPSGNTFSSHYPNDAGDFIANSPLSGIPNDPVDVDVPNISVVEWVSAPDNLRRSLRTRGGAVGRALNFLRVPAVATGSFHLFASSVGFNTVASGYVDGPTEQTPIEFYIPLVF